MSEALSAPVLVLNANFAPINVCNVKRALGLIMSEKATLILNGRGYIRSVRQNVPCPSIIRLSNMVKRPRPSVKLNKREIFRRDHFTCQYCGVKTLNLTLDHIIPKHMGGGHTWENLVAACSSCNLRKGGRTIARSGMKLLSKPALPPGSADYIFGRYLLNNEEWMSFISGW